MSLISASFMTKPMSSPLTPASPRPPLAKVRSPIIDGDKGELLHRGYPIEQLANKSSYLEMCYLLLYGELPNAAQLSDFEGRVTRHTMVHEQMHNFFRGFRRDAHPMATMVGVVGAMSAFYHDSLDINDEWQREVAAIRMVAKLPTIAAMAYKYSVGQPFVYPKNSLSYAGNFLNMCFAVPAEDYRGKPDPRQGDGPDHDAARRSRAERLDLDRASGGLVRREPVRLYRGGHRLPLGSGAWRRKPSLPWKCCAKSALWTASRNISPRPRTRTSGFRLMGFGHRVYKNFDPRATVMKESADEVLELLGIHNNPTLQVAKELERIALSDDYFISKKLYPNVDFYSGIILDAMGFPTSMFTPIFAISRTVGWIAQWKEMIAEKNQKIGRPRQLYVGEKQRDYVDVKHR